MNETLPSLVRRVRRLVSCEKRYTVQIKFPSPSPALKLDDTGRASIPYSNDRTLIEVGRCHGPYGCTSTVMECLPLVMSHPVPISKKEVKI